MSKAIATRERTNEILSKFDIFAKKNYGQNFIVESGIVEKISRNAMCDDIAVIEIGPGIGALTEQLAKRAAKVKCFEIDNRLKEVLEFSLKEYDNIEIEFNDFLTIDLNKQVKELMQVYKNVAICANLPYYITTPILFKIFESKVDLVAITVMMQKEVADRFYAKVGTKDYNALTIISNYYYDCKMIMKIPREIFSPRPNIDSAVIQFTPKKDKIEIKNEVQFFELVKASFKQRRKTIYNNLRDYLKDKDLVIDLLHKANIPENERAEKLTIHDFKRLWEVYNEN